MKPIELKVKEIIPDPESEGCYRLILEDIEEGLEVPMVISALDARPILAEINDEKGIRPHTHDIFTQFIILSGYRLQRVTIHDFRRGVFYASMLFTSENRESLELDCRPTDGIALALRTKAPVYIEEEVVKRVGMLLCNDMGRMKAPQRLKVMEEKLKRLVAEERYEEAGILRDRINTLKLDHSL